MKNNLFQDDPIETTVTGTDDSSEFTKYYSESEYTPEEFYITHTGNPYYDYEKKKSNTTLIVLVAVLIILTFIMGTIIVLLQTGVFSNNKATDIKVIKKEQTPLTTSDNENLSVTDEGSQEPMKVESIDVNYDQVTINLNNLSSTPKISYASAPTRFIADFYGASLPDEYGEQTINGNLITEVRYAVHPGYIRIVIESPETAEFEYEYTQNSMIITVK